jgi:hypothetical protein
MTLRFEEAKAESNFCIKEKIRAINSVWNQSLSLSVSLSLQKLQNTHRRSAFWESTINRFPCCCARLSCWMCAFCTGSLAPHESAGKSQSFFFSFFFLLTALLCPFAALFMRLTLVKTWTAVIWPSHHRRPSSSSSWTSSVFFGCCLFLFVVVALSFSPFLVACCFSSPSKNE